MLKSNNNLLENFNKACKIVKVLPKRPSDDDLLYLYGRYKQATIGDINQPKPSGLFNIKEKKKWDAWYMNKTKSKNLSMNEYIDKVNLLCKK